MTPEPQVQSAVTTWQRWIAVPVIAVSTMVGALLVLRGLGALMHRLVSAAGRLGVVTVWWAARRGAANRSARGARST